MRLHVNVLQRLMVSINSALVPMQVLALFCASLEDVHKLPVREMVASVGVSFLLKKATGVAPATAQHPDPPQMHHSAFGMAFLSQAASAQVPESTWLSSAQKHVIVTPPTQKAL